MKGDSLIPESNYEDALDALQNSNYGEAAELLNKDENEELKAELERLSELLGDETGDMVSGSLGWVLNNYSARLIDDLAKKASEQGESSEE